MRIPRRAGLLLLLGILLPRPVGAEWPGDPAVNVPVCNAPNVQVNPRIISDGARGAILCWDDWRKGSFVNYPTADLDVYAQHVSADGGVDPSWPVDGLAVCTSYQYDGESDIASDGAGGAIIVWSQTYPWPYAPTGYASGIRARHLLANGSFDAAWPAGGVLVGDAPGAYQSGPHLVPDGHGGAIVAWQEVGQSLCAAHLGADGTTAWCTIPLTLEVCISRVILDPMWVSSMQMVADGSGGAFIVAERYNGVDNDILGIHLLFTRDSQGCTQFPCVLGAFTSVFVASGVAHQTRPALASDGADGAFVTWEATEPSGGGWDKNLLAQHLLANGSVDPAWPVGGRSVRFVAGGGASSVLDFPAITSDGSGGALVVWEDDPTSPSPQTMAQHVLPSGALDPVWPANGMALDTGDGSFDRYPLIAPDSRGGVIAVWTKATGGGLYAQRFFSNGTIDPAWPAGGLTLTTRSAGWGGLIPDGAGGAIASFYDWFHGYDIFVQRVRWDGELGGGVTAVAPPSRTEFALDPVSPNPSWGRTVTVRFSLASELPASIDLIDIAGRRIASREVGSMGPGRHSIELGAGSRPASGIYFVRLWQAGQVMTTRVMLLD